MNDNTQSPHTGEHPGMGGSRPGRGTEHAPNGTNGNGRSADGRHADGHDANGRHTRTGESRRDDPDVVDLVGRLTKQSAHLAQQQVNLVQAEMREGVNDIKTAIGAFAGAAIFGMAGLVVVLLGGAYLLAPVIGSLGLATLIVGVVTLLLAAILAGSGKSKASSTNLKPDRSIHTAQDMPDAASGRMHDNEHNGAEHGR